MILVLFVFSPSYLRDTPVPARERDTGEAALSRGLRLFNVYLDACGALYLRPTIWRRLVPLLHPDKGGDVAVFQRVSEMKRLVDLGEEVRCHADDVAPRGDEVDDAIARLRAELHGALESTVRVDNQ